MQLPQYILVKTPDSKYWKTHNIDKEHRGFYFDGSENNTIIFHNQEKEKEFKNSSDWLSLFEGLYGPGTQVKIVNHLVYQRLENKL